MSLQPLEDHILIEPFIEENKSASWLILPDNNKEKPSKWTVVAVWKGKILDNGERWPIDVKIGDVVYFTKYSPDELEIMVNGEKKNYLVIRHSSILVVEG